MNVTNILKSAALCTAVISAVACSVKKTIDMKHPEWAYNATIYELNTRQFTPEGTFAAAEAQLTRLRDLDVDIIWMMPLQPIGELERKGTLGSYYAIKDYKGINPEYGTKEDLQRFMTKAHELGFKVILDWVANHTSPDALWVANDGWHVRDSLGALAVQYDWTDITELNYDNQDMCLAMTNAMRYWVEEMDFDGFRCDMAMLVPTPFWEKTVAELKTVKPELFMLSEAEEVDLTHNAFNMYYGWSIHHIMNDVAQGKANVNKIWENFAERTEKFDKSAISMLFTSNHDENSHAGTEFQRMGDAATTFAAFTYVMPSMPLIYTGQELGSDKRLEFFEKDTINPVNPEFYTKLYKDLNRLRKSNPALWSGELGGDMVAIGNTSPEQIFSMMRSIDGNTVVAVMNLSGSPVTFNLTDGEYAGQFRQFPDESKVEIGASQQFNLQPWEYRIYTKK